MKRTSVKQAMAAVPTLAVTETDYQAKGYHLDVSVAPEQVVAAATVLDRENFFLEAVTGVDRLGEKAAAQKAAAKAKAAEKSAEAAAEEGADPTPAAAPEEPAAAPEEELEVVYDYNHYEESCRVVVRTRILRSNPELPTISGVYPGADWHERETHDFFGIRFSGHPCLRPLLLPEDADFHPLLKDFTA